MRLWTLHPMYLDCRGLVALWRESLLAQAVLKGQTRGYIHHPQLIRFRDNRSPIEAISFYLQVVHAEAVQRGFCFDAPKFTSVDAVETIAVGQGQLEYEWEHLKAKLRMRDPLWLARFEVLSLPEAHALFRIVPGTVAEWEITQPSRKIERTRT